MGLSFDVLNKVDYIIFQDDFFVFDFKIDFMMPIILSRQLLAMIGPLVVMERDDLCLG